MVRKILIILIFLILAPGIKDATASNTNSADLESTSSQYFYAADQPSLDVVGDITLEAWIKLESMPTSTYVIVSKWNSGASNQKSCRFDYVTGDKLAFEWSNNGSGADQHLSSTLNLLIGTWYHVSVVFTAASHSSTFYLNGNAVGTDSSGSRTSIYSSSAPFFIGDLYVSDVAGAYYLDGKIDDVRIWNRVRTAAEIAADYQKELAGNESGLVGYWKFNGNTNDSTANGNNLTNNGGAIFSTDVPFSGTTTTTPPPPTVLICSIGNPVDVNSVSDINGNNFPETVTLGYNSSNIPTVCFADVSTSAFIKELQFFAAGWILKDMFLAPDMSSPADGIPDISVMATNGNLNKIQIKDAVSGALIKEITLP